MIAPDRGRVGARHVRQVLGAHAADAPWVSLTAARRTFEQRTIATALARHCGAAHRGGAGAGHLAPGSGESDQAPGPRGRRRTRERGCLRRTRWAIIGRLLRYVLRRVVLTIPVLLGVATLVFPLIHLVPGDPAEAMLGETAPAADLAELRTKLGLDQPLAVQYGRYLSGLARGDLGTSFRYETPVRQEIAQRLGRTAQLAAAAMVVAVCIALPLGIVGALFRGRPIDQAAMTLSLVGISMPNFWLGPAAGDRVRGLARLAARVGDGHRSRTSCCRR